jgi:hypothetical protein
MTPATFNLLRLAWAAPVVGGLIFRLPVILAAAARPGWLAPLAWLNQRQKPVNYRRR